MRVKPPVVDKYLPLMLSSFPFCLGLRQGKYKPFWRTMDWSMEVMQTHQQKNLISKKKRLVFFCKVLLLSAHFFLVDWYGIFSKTPASLNQSVCRWVSRVRGAHSDSGWRSSRCIRNNFRPQRLKVAGASSSLVQIPLKGPLSSPFLRYLLQLSIPLTSTLSLHDGKDRLREEQ